MEEAPGSGHLPASLGYSSFQSLVQPQCFILPLLRCALSHLEPHGSQVHRVPGLGDMHMAGEGCFPIYD